MVLMYSPAASFLAPPHLDGFRVPFPGEDVFSFLLQNFHLIDYHLAAFITVMLARRLVWALISEVTFPPSIPSPACRTAAEHGHPWPKKILQVGGFLPSEKSGYEGLSFWDALLPWSLLLETSHVLQYWVALLPLRLKRR